MASRLAVLSLALAATGCTLGPNYHRPAVPTPPNWRDLPAAEAQSLANTPWWEVFDDPQLQELVRIALQENKDLKIAVERIEEARARYGFTRADLFPRVDANATAGRLRFSDASLVHTPTGDETNATSGRETPIYALSADLSWEIDFFGRIRRATESQRALFFATHEARRSTVITLVADVARVYLELRALDLELEIARRTIVSRREYLQLARDRFEGGVTHEVDYRQAEAELHRIEAITFDLERLIAQQENLLSVLLGRNPGPITRGRSVTEQKLPAAVPAGLPSELLERRPDVLEAEQVLASATANIGQAKALLFPRVALTGSFGFASTELDTLFDGPSKSWNIIGNLLQPLFNAGKNRRRVEITESQQRQTLYEYERTIIQAFRETEDALVAYRKIGEQRAAQAARVAAERKVLELAEMRYRGGVAAYLEVLDAQRSLFGAEMDETQTISAHLVSLVQLYKALGGGWPGSATDPTGPPPPPSPGAPPPSPGAPAPTQSASPRSGGS
jgi:multidrug efflux system outer membrane protein